MNKTLKGDIDVIDEEQYRKVDIHEYDEPETNNTPLSHITDGSKHFKSILKVDENANPKLVFCSDSKSSQFSPNMLRCSEIIQRDQTSHRKKSNIKSIISLGTNGNLVSQGSSVNLTYSKTGDVSHIKV